jgi:hypothetical protein
MNCPPNPIPGASPLCAGCGATARLRVLDVLFGKGLACPRCIRKANKSFEFEARLHAALKAGVPVAEVNALFRRVGPLPGVRVPVGDAVARDVIAAQLRAAAYAGSVTPPGRMPL